MYRLKMTMPLDQSYTKTHAQRKKNLIIKANSKRLNYTPLSPLFFFKSKDLYTKSSAVMNIFNFPLYPLHMILLCYSALLAAGLSTTTTLRNETDRLALIAFKSHITSDPQAVTNSWNESQHFCEWEGVTCSRRHQRVTILNLESRGLVGSIPPEVGNLSFLRIINLQNNSFQGIIPPQLGNLFRLRFLFLINNSIVGNIPVNISMCSNLEFLRLSSNRLTGGVPMEVGSLSKLSLLGINENLLTGGIPPSLGNLTSLKTLSMADNSFGGSIPRSFGHFKRLSFLSLTSCMLSGTFAPSIYNLSTLEVLSISNNQLSGSLPIDIGFTLPNLKRIFIGMNQFSGKIPLSLLNASKLEKIDLSINDFTGNVPVNMGNLRKLQLISLHRNNLGSGQSGDLDFITSLSNCSDLNYFLINFNQFGGQLPISIANFSTQLYMMAMGENKISGNIPREIGKFQNLIAFDMSNNLLTGIIPESIGNLQNLGFLGANNNLLSGQIPSTIGNMSRLFLLSLTANNLEGNIAPSLKNRALQVLELHYNNFTGTIPQREIRQSTRLTELWLGHNILNGSVPLEVGSLINLQILQISHNNFSGEIPETLGGCTVLEYLHLQNNLFNGPVPSFMSSLKGLLDLNLSQNYFSGIIPKELVMLSSLKHLDLSFNNIEGEVPKQGIFGNASAFSILGNDKLCGGIPKLGLPICPITKSKKGRSFSLKVTLAVLIPSFILSLFVIIIIYWRRTQKARPLTQEIPGNLTRVSFIDLHRATDGFSRGNLIGMGSYGSVYNGFLPQGQVAVKVLNLMEPGASKSFLAECEALREIRHRNLLKILTVCSSTDFDGNDFKALVFEYMPNGSLESWLHGSSSDGDSDRNLSIYTRMDIAIDVATAMDYLHNHCERPIVHCDLKSSNILLDSDMTANVGDFGLAKLLPMSSNNNNNSKMSSFSIRGTIGYIPPEYGMGAKISTLGDVYSYGILLQEMFTGKRPTDNIFKDGLCLHEFCKMALDQGLMDIIDVRMLYEDALNEAPELIHKIKECINSVIRIGIACSVESAAQRMEIKDVMKELHLIRGDLVSSLS